MVERHPIASLMHREVAAATTGLLKLGAKPGMTPFATS